MNEQQVLRELGAAEKYFAIESQTYNVLTHALITTSQIDFNSHPSLIEQAVSEWKRINPFLRASVRVDENANSKAFFVVNEALADDTWNNVKLLEFDSSPENDELSEVIWKLLADVETSEQIDVQNGLLWRLKFFRIKEFKESNEIFFKYALIFSINHCISDRKNKYLNQLELLSMIEQMYTQTYVPRSTYNLVPYVEDIFKEYKIKEASLYKKQEDFEFPKKPRFLRQCMSSSQPAKIDFNKQELNKYIISRKKTDRENYLLLSDLINSVEKSISRSKMFKVEKEIYESFLKECKKHNVKVNGCLNVLLVLALKMLYLEHGEQLNEALYFNSIDLRQFVLTHEQNSFRTFSYMATSLLKRLSIQSNGIEENLADFWQLAQEESASLHRRIENNEQYVRYDWSGLHSITDEQIYVHFFCSNLGILPSRLNEQSDESVQLIRVRETYEVLNVSSDEDILFDFKLASIDKTLCFTIVYNSLFLCQSLVERLSQNISILFKKIQA